MNINVKVEYNELSEYQRFVFSCIQIFRGFYQSKRFYLSHVLLKLEERQVYLPDIDVQKIDGFWKEIEQIEKDLDKKSVLALTKRMREQKIPLKSLTDKELERFKERVEGFLEKAVKDICTVFPRLKDKEFIITIKPTLYGTNGSFERTEIKKNSVNMTVTLRVDKSNDYLLEIMLSSIVWAIKYEHNKKIITWQMDWEINESIVDFFLQHTLLNKYAENYIGTMQIVENPEIYYLDIIEKSKDIFEKLGYPINKFINVENNEILINGEIPKKQFTDQEKKVVKRLAENKGRLISNDELEEVLWGNDLDKHSLWALAKTMQRIRNKIKESGIASEIIQTVRGKGYLIYD